MRTGKLTWNAASVDVEGAVRAGRAAEGVSRWANVVEGYSNVSMLGRSLSKLIMHTR